MLNFSENVQKNLTSGGKCYIINVYVNAMTELSDKLRVREGTVGASSC